MESASPLELYHTRCVQRKQEASHNPTARQDSNSPLLFNFDYVYIVYQVYRKRVGKIRSKSKQQYTRYGPVRESGVESDENK